MNASANTPIMAIAASFTNTAASSMSITTPRLPNLARQCVSHVQAGADMVAPSGMMDGMVAAIRKGLDDAGYKHPRS